MNGDFLASDDDRKCLYADPMLAAVAVGLMAVAVMVVIGIILEVC